MKKAYRINIVLSKSESIERQVAYLKSVFENREIKFVCNIIDDVAPLIFFSDGEDDLQSIFRCIRENPFQFKKVDILKLTLQNKKKLNPKTMNSIVFTSNAVQFEEINLNNQDYVGIGENLTIIRYEDIQLPDKVYKYRGWSKEEHKKTLTHSELYFAPPSSFGDHHECNLPLRYDLVTPEFKRKWLINSSKEINPKFSRKKHKEFVNKWIKNSPFNDPEHRKRVEQDFRLKLDNELGILSLTPIGNNPDMWDYFGEDHTGISIGFNSRNLFVSNETFASGGPIEYYEPNNPPIVMPFHLNSKERVKAGFTNVFSLPKQWEHEQEFRVAKLHIRNRVINFNSESIVEVILGSRMNIQDKEEVLSIIRIQYPNIDVFESVINVNGELILNKIEL